jgi:anti-sigma factor ChrR (cupin superfamily)
VWIVNCLDDATISAYVDGELAPADVRAAAAHIESCANCRAKYERVKHVDAGLRRMFAAMPVGMPRIPVADWRRRARTLAGPLAVAAAAAVALAVISGAAWMVMRDGAPAGMPRQVASEQAKAPAAVQPETAIEPNEPVAMWTAMAEDIAALRDPGSCSPEEYQRRLANVRRWARPAADMLPGWKVEQYRRVLLYSHAIMPMDNG